MSKIAAVIGVVLALLLVAGNAQAKPPAPYTPNAEIVYDGNFPQAGQLTDIYLNCPEGKMATSGGWDYGDNVGGNEQNSPLLFNRPNPAEGVPTGWNFRFGPDNEPSNEAEGDEIGVYVVCINAQ
jgi:hypothetical protein